MDDVGKLVLFRDVVDLEGFSRAAAKWGLDHSTVSKHVKRLESQLGVQLLHRTSRSMRLTESGRMVHEYGRRIGGCMDELMQRLEEQRTEIGGSLHVTSLVHIGRHVVQPAVASLIAEHPQVTVTLSLHDRPLAFHREGYDLAVRVGLPSEASLRARKLMDNPVCLAAAPELMRRIEPLGHPSQLATRPTVAYVSGAVDITAWPYVDGAEHRSVVVQPRYRVDDGNALLDAVRAGLGIGYLSSFAARADFERGTLVPVLPQFELPPYAPIYALRSASEYVSPTLAALLRHLDAVAEPLGQANRGQSIG